MKLNLGCGYDIKEGWVNCDWIKGEGVDKIVDLNNLPYDFEDNCIEEILLCHILEHLNNPKLVIDELWRISKNGARIKIEVPHFSCWQSWGDITHVRTFNSTSLENFRHDGRKRNLLNEGKVRFKVSPKIIMPKFWRLIGIEKMINIHNATRCFYERNFAQIFPARNIKWELIVVKKKLAQDNKEVKQ